MTTKTKNIISWVLAGLVAFIFLGSGISKLFPNAETLANATKIGLNESSFKILGIIELLSVALFLFPRTGIFGSLLLVAYMGGAICAHLITAQSILAPVLISVFLWIVILVRFPELTKRILRKA